VDDQRFGAVIRATRIARGVTQEELGRAARASGASISRLERGLAETLALRTIREIARALEVRVELLPRSRAAGIERIANAAHAALAEAVVAFVTRFGGWVVRPEVGFSHYGERGVIDLVCWHASRRALLIVELKTELVDINELLGTLDRYARNAVGAVAPMGWRPATVSRLLVIGDSHYNRSRVERHAGLFRAALPDRVVAARSFLRDPAAELAGLIFFANRHPGTANSRIATVRRVRRSTRSRC